MSLPYPDMKVAYFTDTDRSGGAERVLLDMVRGADDAGHQVLVMAPQTWLLADVLAYVPTAKIILVGDARYRSLPGLVARGAAVISQVPAIARVLQSEKPDVLHVSNGGYPGSDLCRLAIIAARALGVPRTVLSVHAVPRPRVRGQSPGQRAIDTTVWRCTQRVVGATSAVEKGLRELRGMPTSLYQRIPYGVRYPGGDDAGLVLRQKWGVKSDELLFGMVSASSDEAKGHAVFLAALARTPRVRAVFVGASLSSPDVIRAAQPDLVGRVVLAGRIPDMGAAYHALDALVVPSIADESLPLVVLEAMACGRAVLASDISGIPEAVQHGLTGALFPPGDDAALSVLMGATANNLANWGQAGRRRWSSHFSVDTMNDALHNLYV